MVVDKCARFMTLAVNVTAVYADRLFLIAYIRIAVTALEFNFYGGTD